MEDSSSDGSHSHDGSVNRGTLPEKVEKDDSRELTGGLSAVVRRQKIVVMVVLCVCAIACATGVFLFVRKEEKDDFSHKYFDLTDEIVALVHSEAQNVFNAVEFLSIDITSFALGADAQWPNITVPHFEARAGEALGLAKSEKIMFAPLVRREEKAQWERYAQDHKSWISETYLLDEELRDSCSVSSGVPKKCIGLSDIDPYIFKFEYNGSHSDDHDEEHNEDEDHHDEEHGEDEDHHDEEHGEDEDHHDEEHEDEDHHDEDEDHHDGEHGEDEDQHNVHNHEEDYREGDHEHAHQAYHDDDKVVQDGPGVSYGHGQYAPLWQQTPFSQKMSIVNYDLLSHPVLEELYSVVFSTNQPSVSEIADLHFLYEENEAEGHSDDEKVYSFLMHPIHSHLSTHVRTEHIVGFVLAVIPWEHLFRHVLRPGNSDIVLVLDDNCGGRYTFNLEAGAAVQLGAGDLHDASYEAYKVSTKFAPFLVDQSGSDRHCEYEISLYPSETFEKAFMTSGPAVLSAAIFGIFLFTAILFLSFDVTVARRQRRVLATAKKTDTIVSSLFPSHVRERILDNAEMDALEKSTEDNVFISPLKDAATKFNKVIQKHKRDFSNEGYSMSKPIAELFPETTIFQADIVGFTAWSSTREPSQVFILLETIFSAFDKIAKQRGIFKVETVGDCYIAVSGLPEPRKDHAVVMARFAKDCLFQMRKLTKELEVTLGPDTTDLSIRIGLHSGPVTAGVLRGERSRFQLFGETMNTASLMESTGLPYEIQISLETADLLKKMGKDHWVKLGDKTADTPRSFFLKFKMDTGSSVEQDSTSRSDRGLDDEGECLDDQGEIPHDAKLGQDISSQNGNRLQRLVDWNSDVLIRILKQVLIRRHLSSKIKQGIDHSEANEADSVISNNNVIDEVEEIIELPAFDTTVASIQENSETVELPEAVVNQLRHYVKSVSLLYHENPFHNFEHASHVAMSVVKLLSRIGAPHQVRMEPNDRDIALVLHDHTYGITSDPLTQFACIYSALIHDVDHTGVPNSQLVNENDPLAKVYKNKSVAEQNSVDLAWDLLQDSQYVDFWNLLCESSSEKKRFRQLVVNSVMATDIMDKDLKALRNARWEKAFEKGSLETDSVGDSINRKATIVIEHIIQASDVAHTMQHWHVYRKWNERLFHELYLAYKCGRGKDPIEFWYEGEIAFFDFYIIPLAKKLKECGVFGVSSDEYLNYALKNRQEWECKGQEVVSSMAGKYKEMYENMTVDDRMIRKQDDRTGFGRLVMERLSTGQTDEHDHRFL